MNITDPPTLVSNVSESLNLQDVSKRTELNDSCAVRDEAWETSPEILAEQSHLNNKSIPLSLEQPSMENRDKVDESINQEDDLSQKEEIQSNLEYQKGTNSNDSLNQNIPTVESKCPEEKQAGVIDESANQSSPESGETIPPNRTLYVNNLNSKIKLPQLKKDLEGIFSNFGVVRQIVAMSSFWRRGQAWIVFAEQESADKALAQLQGFPYASKEMRIQYAREISDIFTKEAGTYVKRPPGPKKPRAIIEREKKLQSQLQQFQQMVLQHMHQQQQLGDNSTQPLSQPLQAASAIAAQVQQVMQQPSLLAMFPNAGFPQNNSLQAAQKAQQPTHLVNSNLHKSFPHLQGMQLYPTPTGVVPMGGNGFQSIPFGRPPGSLQNMVPGIHPSRQDKMMMMPNQPYMMKNVSGMGRGMPNMGTMTHDMKAGAPSPPMSKDAVVAAAAAAAAAAISAAKKRANENANALSTTPRHTLRGVNPNTSRPMGFSQLSTPTSGIPPISTTGDHSNPNNYSQQGFPTQNYSIGTTIPNRTLCVEGLPEDCTLKSLEMVFKQHPGCGEIRHVASHCVAFIDFETIPQSTAAMGRFQNFPIKENCNLRISYARQ